MKTQFMIVYSLLFTSFFLTLLHPPSRLILFIGIQLVAPMDVLGSSGVGSAMGTASSIQCAVCRFIPGLTPSQVDMCCEFPRAILLLSGTQKVMRAECRWQFRKELWNCSELDMPLFKETVLPGNYNNYVLSIMYKCKSKNVFHLL